MSSKAELIKRDILDFRHSHKFDEIITDMPTSGAGRDLSALETLYKGFFKKLPTLLESDGVVFIYTRNRELLRKWSLAGGFRILKEYEISKMEGSYYFILTRNSRENNY